MFQFFDLLVLLAIAVFILSRLYNILGKVDEDQEKPKKNKALIDMLLGKAPSPCSTDFPQPQQAEVIDVNEATLSAALRQKLSMIKTLEQDFSLDKFLQGVRKAYAMIHSAMSSRNVEILSHLLSPELYQKTKAQFAQQDEKKQLITRNIINIREIEVKDIQITVATDGGNTLNQNTYNGSDNGHTTATITVSIQNNQTYVLKDDMGNILDGNEDRIITSLDSWKFAKVLGKKSAWLLVAD